MSLTLTIVSPNASGLQGRRNLGEGTLTIGRDPGVDWPLPDPDRLLSRHHCTIECEHGTYYLVDHSTNGVFLGPDRQRVDKGQRIALNDGEMIALGDYRIEAALGVQAPPKPPENRNEDIWPSMESQAAEPALPIDPLIPDDVSLLEGLGPTALPDDFDPGRTTDDHVPAEQAFFRPPEPEAVRDPDPAPEPPVEPAATMRPQSAPGPRTSLPHADGEPAPGTSTAHVDSDASLNAFLQGAGLEAGRLAAGNVDPRQLFHRLGRNYRLLVEGLIEVLRARSQVKGELRADQTLLGRECNNPLKFATDPDDALEHLLVPRGGAFLEPEQAIRQAYQDLQTHQLALIAALQTTLTDLLKRLNPQSLEARMAAKPGLLGRMAGSADAQKWHAFTTLYEEIAQEVDEDFREFFRREFRQAYDAQIKRLRSS